MFDQFFNFVIFISPKVKRVKSRGDDNMTWFQAFKIAFMGGQTGRGAGRQRQEPPTLPTAQTPVVGEGTLPTRDDATTEQRGEDDAENLDNSKEKNNNMTTTTDNADDVVLNEPSATPASDLRQP